MPGYRVAAGYVTVPFAVDGAVAHRDVPRGDLLPGDVPDEHVQALLTAGHIVEDEASAEPDEKPAAPRKRATKSTK